MTKPCSVDPYIVNLKTAAKTLKLLLETHSCEDVDLLELMSTAVVGLCLMALSIKISLKMFMFYFAKCNKFLYILNARWVLLSWGEFIEF